MSLYQLRGMVLLSMFIGLFQWFYAIPMLYAASQQWGPYESEGTVINVKPDQGLIVLNHEPIVGPGFLMGQMEMAFSIADPSVMAGLKPDDRVHFRVGEEKKSRIVELRKLPQ